MLPSETIESKILIIRNKKVILDRDLATLYEVTTKNLKRQVKRNITRFPDDFMFEITKEELERSRCQNGTLNKRGSNIKYLPYAFTENGIAMLSSVLTSHKAVQVNIQIMRVFTSMRKQALTHIEILKKLEEIDKNFINQNIINKRNDQQMKVIFEAIRHIIEPSPPSNKKFGFITEKDEND